MSAVYFHENWQTAMHRKFSVWHSELLIHAINWLGQHCVLCCNTILRLLSLESPAELAVVLISSVLSFPPKEQLHI